MRNNRFQNRVSESSLTLPLCGVAVTLAWFMPFDGQNLLLAVPTWLLTCLTTYVIMEINGKHAIMRIRTRMMSAVWLAGVAVMPFLQHSFTVSVTTFAMAVSYYLLFKCCNRTEPVHIVFHSFFMLGVVSLIVPQLLVMTLLYYWYLAVFLRCMSWRCFWAGLIGVALPVWFAVGWCIVTNDISPVTERIQELMRLDAVSLEAFIGMPSLHFIALALVTLLSLVASAHYLSNYYQDKINTRMFLYIYVMQTLFLWTAIILQPRLLVSVIPLLWLSASPLVAHFFALTGRIWTNLFFCLSILATVALGVLGRFSGIINPDILLPWK